MRSGTWKVYLVHVVIPEAHAPHDSNSANVELRAPCKSSKVWRTDATLVPTTSCRRRDRIFKQFSPIYVCCATCGGLTRLRSLLRWLDLDLEPFAITASALFVGDSALSAFRRNES